MRTSFSAYFVTLTYKDKFVPMGENGYSANKNDHKHFIKWLRYYENEELEQLSKDEYLRNGKATKEETGSLSYYGTIEYGDLKDRPHWHYLLFNVRDINNIILAWTDSVCYNEELQQFDTGPSKGIVQVDECNVNTIDYVLKYMVKERSKETYDGKERELSFMSKGLGLGAVNQEFLKHIRSDSGNQVINSRSRKIPLPRYFRKKFLTNEQREDKNRYIRNEIEEQEKKQDAEWKKQGLNTDLVRQQGKEIRNN